MVAMPAAIWRRPSVMLVGCPRSASSRPWPDARGFDSLTLPPVSVLRVWLVLTLSDAPCYSCNLKPLAPRWLLWVATSPNAPAGPSNYSAADFLPASVVTNRVRVFSRPRCGGRSVWPGHVHVFKAVAGSSFKGDPPHAAHCHRGGCMRIRAAGRLGPDHARGARSFSANGHPGAGRNSGIEDRGGRQLGSPSSQPVGTGHELEHTLGAFLRL